MSDLFATIPETTLPSGLVVPEFKLARYLSTVIDGKATIQPDAMSTVRISYHEAVKAAEAGGMKLIKETQHAALRHLLYNDGRNWTSGEVGVGDLRQGLRKYNVSGRVQNNYIPEDSDEDRSFYLPNGDVISDAAGHLYSWVYDDIQGNEKGIVARAFTAGSPSIQVPHPSMTRGVGWYPSAGANWSGYALLRGGCWDSGGGAGVFRLGSVGPSSARGGVGFRCTL